MVYKIIKPERGSIKRQVWNAAKASLLFWVFFIVSALLTVYLLTITRASIKSLENLDLLLTCLYPLFVPLGYLLYIEKKLIISLWMTEIAKINGWKYKPNSDPREEFGIMFQQGNSRESAGQISGVMDGKKFRMLDYQFSQGYGRGEVVYSYIVFAFKFNGSFPHIYLNNKHNSYNIKIGEEIPIPLEFEKQFSLSAPRKYEIEALEIFTPDVLLKILESDFIHDVEFVNQEVLIFADGIITDFEKLEKEFSRALELKNLFEEKLDKFKFEKVGDMSHKL